MDNVLSKFQNLINWKFPYYTKVSKLENKYLMEIFIGNNLSFKSYYQKMLSDLMEIIFFENILG